jgi:hypothetical protein
MWRPFLVKAPESASAPQMLEPFLENLPGAVDAGFDGFRAALSKAGDFRVAESFVNEESQGFSKVQW